MGVRFKKSNKMIVAATGHRPKHCPCKYKKKHPWLDNLRGRLKFYLKSLDSTQKKGIIVRTGGAIGWDTWVAQAALELNIELHLFLPFPGQAERSQQEYERIKSLATQVNYTSETFHKRNMDIIDGADQIVALLDPEVTSGGTYCTVQEAKRLDIDVINFWKGKL